MVKQFSFCVWLWVLRSLLQNSEHCNPPKYKKSKPDSHLGISWEHMLSSRACKQNSSTFKAFQYIVLAWHTFILTSNPNLLSECNSPRHGGVVVGFRLPAEKQLSHSTSVVMLLAKFDRASTRKGAKYRIQGQCRSLFRKLGQAAYLNRTGGL